MNKQLLSLAFFISFPTITFSTEELCQKSKLENYCQFLQKDSKQISEFSQSGENIISLLDQCKNLKTEEFYSYFRAINNTAKQCVYLDIQAFNKILEKLNEVLKIHLKPKNPDTEKKDLAEKEESKDFLKVERIILNEFLENYQSFQEEPDSFIQDISKKVTSEIKPEKKLSTEDLLRENVIRFVELNLNKVLWDQNEHDSIFDSITKLANEVFKLCQSSTVRHMDQLNDLFKSLIFRFNYFLTISGDDLPAYFFDDFKERVSSGEADFFLDVKDPEKFILSNKKEVLTTLSYWQAKSKAREESGLLV